MNTIDKAIAFAARAHSGQCRKGTRIPYIVHPLGVARILIQRGCPDHVVIAGILHDTVEDTLVTLEEIRQGFGCDVAALVDAATEPDRNDTWENRKKHTLGMVHTLSDEAALLVLADKLDNIRAIREDLEANSEALWDRFKRPREQQQWYYENLASAFAGRLADEQSRILLECFKSEVERVFGGVPCGVRGQGVIKKPGSTLTKQDVLNIFMRHIEQDKPHVSIYYVTDVAPANCRVYNLPQQDCWFITCSPRQFPSTIICSSRIVAISKTTGDVVYDDSTNDEG